MPRLRYLRERIPYHGSNPVRRWNHGDEDEVSEAEAERLVTSFPEWFERVAVKPQSTGTASAELATPGEGDSPAPARGVHQRVTKPARGREK